MSLWWIWICSDSTETEAVKIEKCISKAGRVTPERKTYTGKRRRENMKIIKGSCRTCLLTKDEQIKPISWRNICKENRRNIQTERCWTNDWSISMTEATKEPDKESCVEVCVMLLLRFHSLILSGLLCHMLEGYPVFKTHCYISFQLQYNLYSRVLFYFTAFFHWHLFSTHPIKSLSTCLCFCAFTAKWLNKHLDNV